VKDPKGKITLHVWDKDPEDEVKTFSAKFWKEETDDFLGMVSLFCQLCSTEEQILTELCCLLLK